MKIKALPIFLLLLSVGLALRAQTWEDVIADIEKKYVSKGKYQKALDKMPKIRKKLLDKQVGEKRDLVGIWLDIYALHIKNEMGFIKGLEESLVRQIDNAHTRAGSASVHEAVVAIAHATDVIINYGNYNLALEKLLEAEEKFKDSQFYTPRSEAELSLRLARAYAYTGQIQLAEKYATKLYEFTSKLDLGKKAPKADKRLAAEASMLKGEIAAQYGEFDKATAFFDEAKKQAKSWRANLAADYKVRIDLLKAQNYWNGEDYGEIEKTCKKVVQDGSKFVRLVTSAQEIMIYYYIWREQANPAYDFLKLHKKTYSKINKNQDSFYEIKNEILRSLITSNFHEAGTSLAFQVFRTLLAKDSTTFPANHPLRLEMYRRKTDMTYQFTTSAVLEAEKNLLPMLQLYKMLYGEKSPHTQAAITEYIWFRLKYTQLDAETANKEINTVDITSIENNLHRFHPTFIVTNDRFAEFYMMTDNLLRAIELTDRAVTLRMEKYGDKDSETGIYLSKLADLQIEAGQYRQAEDNINKALPIIKKGLGNNTMEYADAQAIAAKLSLSLGMYDEAKKSFRKSANIYKSLIKKDPSIKGKNIEDLAPLYVQIGEYNFAEEQLSILIEKRTSIYGTKHRELIKPYIELANLYLVRGEYSDAEKYASQALNISKTILGENSISYAASADQLAKIYTALGSYSKALDLEIQALNIRKKSLGNKHISVAQSLSAIAMLKFTMSTQNLQEAEELMSQAESIVLSNFNDKHPVYAEALKNEAMLFIEGKNYELARQKLEIAADIFESKLDKKNTSSAEILLILGDIYLHENQFKKAEKSYEKAESIYASLLSKSHPNYIKTQSKLAQIHYVSGDYKKANDELDVIVVAYLDFIQRYFPSLSENEKAEFWQLMRPDFEFFNSLAVAQAKERPKMLAQMYNITLATKAILLSSSQKVRQQVAKSNNQELKDLFAKWVERKEYLTSILAMSQEQMVENQINVSDIQSEIESLEKQLSEKSDIFAFFFEGNIFSWEDVQKTLRPNEVAIEIIRYRHFDKGFTNQIKYAALIVSTETQKQPELVLMENGNDMEGKYVRYYRNCMIHQINDENSYQVFWKPIEKALPKNISKVFISPDGVYNQLNIESFLTESGEHILDKYSVNLVSNTKDLVLKRPQVEKKKKEKKKTTEVVKTTETDKKVVLFGNPTFYTNEESYYDAQTRGRFIKSLPGTAIEINKISNLIKQKGWKVIEYTESTATEAVLKTEDNPTILHIATHGFFDNKKPDDNINTFSATRIAQNPLLKSGILAAASGELLASGNSYNAQEGVLTAFEAMNLNYENTELVVLSACETGLGKIEAGEGVFGLQRAFLVAGADVLIMSIFKVSDEATQKLMEQFYNNWLNQGMKKREAFYAAQKEIKKDYPHPIFWGAFNMIGIEKE